MASGKLSATVVGLGYVGLPTAALLASRGFRVNGNDIDAARIEAFARRGVAEHWRLRSEPDGATAIECRWEVHPAEGRYAQLAEFRGAERVISPTFPDLELRPADLDDPGP